MVGALLLADTSGAGPYAQLSSSQNQLGSTNPKAVKLDQSDATKEISNANGVVTFKRAGAYFVMAAAQVGSASRKGQGSVRLWLRQNGRDVVNSNTEQTIVPAFTAVLISQGVVEIKAGDKLELVYSVTAADQGLGLIASTPSGEPVVPSMIFSAFKIDDSAFAQISSSETQPAGGAGKAIRLNTTDATKDIENSAGGLTVKNSGTYFVMAAGQVGGTAPGGKGRVRLWVRQNGEDVRNSNCEQSVSPGFTAVLVCQGVMVCKAGDRVELVQSASGSGVGMVASAPQGEPAVPSAIISFIKVADGAYAQLSSVQSQPGASYAKLITLDQTDAARNIQNATGTLSIAINKGTITVTQDGVYFALAAGQVGNIDGKGSGSVRLWLRQNGLDVAKSNTEQTISNNYTGVLVSQGVNSARQGDKLQLFYSAQGIGVGLVTAQPKKEPAIPSMIFSLVKVD